MLRIFLLLCWLLSPAAPAEPFRVTRSGSLLAVQGDGFQVRDQSGSWRGRLEPGARLFWKGKPTRLSALPLGTPLVFRIVGEVSAPLRRVDAIADPETASGWVARTVPVPGYTREGYGPMGTLEPPGNAPRPGRRP